MVSVKWLAEHAIINCTFAQTIAKTGFHRDLVAEVSLVLDSSALSCATEDVELLLIQEIPAATYVDYDEVEELTRLNLPGAMSILREKEKPMETEKMAHISRERRIKLTIPSHSLKLAPLAPTSALVKLEAKAQIPIHARYQLPQDGSSIRLTVPSGKLCFRCKDELCPFPQKYCRLHKDKGVCGALFAGSEWHTMRCEDPPTDMQFAIPVGSVEDKSMVSIVTNAAVFLGGATISFVSLQNRI